ncbi:hypothetical protein DFH77_001696 [Clostridium beijerinckii]|nr:hypothetical protein [Clostridium beijerinckii]NRU21502.1 hypothetical protein [Clostridium beijerinckii]NRW38871.1 hypothetical protein [Clostridium beijerinckii]NYC18472.1 hypothetical protein [Clostridium beijerinckii]
MLLTGSKTVFQKGIEFIRRKINESRIKLLNKDNKKRSSSIIG